MEVSEDILKVFSQILQHIKEQQFNFLTKA